MSETQFLELVKQNQGIIFKLVGIYAADSEEKKDLYQQILLNAWKGWPNYRGEAKFSTWLYRICLNTIFTLKRKTNRIEYKDSLDEYARLADHNAGPNDDAQRLCQAFNP